jgi:hypothetical protein
LDLYSHLEKRSTPVCLEEANLCKKPSAIANNNSRF